MNTDSPDPQNYRQVLMSALGALLLIMTLPGCYTASPSYTAVDPSAIPTHTATPIPSPTSKPSRTPTPAAPPEGTIKLEVVDISQVSITMPVREKLLVTAYRTENSEHEVGLLDLKRLQFVRVWSSASSELDCCWSIHWSPDGKHFVCECSNFPMNSYAVFSFSDQQEYFLGTRYYGHIAWSPDGSYLLFQNCQGHYPESGLIYSVYDASTWSKIANVGWTHPMGACGYRPMIISQFTDQYCNTSTTWDDHGQPDSGVYCRLPLKDGRGWLLAVGSTGLRSTFCASPEACPNIDSAELTEYEYSPGKFQSERYQSIIENYWLRMVDIENGIQTTYLIPGYRIKTITWSPD